MDSIYHQLLKLVKIVNHVTYVMLVIKLALNVQET